MHYITKDTLANGNNLNKSEKAGKREVEVTNFDMLNSKPLIVLDGKEYTGSLNYIKPGIGEATRVLLRRVPWRIILNEKYKNSPELLHIIKLAKEKNVTVETSMTNLGNYKVCGIIKNLADI